MGNKTCPGKWKMGNTIIHTSYVAQPHKNGTILRLYQDVPWISPLHISPQILCFHNQHTPLYSIPAS